MTAVAHAWIVLPAVLLAGGLIGASGIGGVLLVPVLTRLGDVALPQAIAAASLGFALPALVALGPLRRQPALARRCIPMLAGALLGAAIGALLVHRLPAQALMTGVTALVLFAGVRGLLASRIAAPTSAAAQPLGMAAMAALGVVVGLGSAITGTGGPVLVLPLLLLLRQPVLFAVVAAQAVQLPVALASSAVHLAAGRLDAPLALLCGALLLAGSIAGQRAATGMDMRQMQRMVSLLLLAAGGWFAWLLLG
ncbi:MAG: sulfite exporter TauE/SafE family protein [Variovorax sp.]